MRKKDCNFLFTTFTINKQHYIIHFIRFDNTLVMSRYMSSIVISIYRWKYVYLQFKVTWSPITKWQKGSDRFLSQNAHKFVCWCCAFTLTRDILWTEKMHFSIPDTQECKDDSGSSYTVSFVLLLTRILPWAQVFTSWQHTTNDIWQERFLSVCAPAFSMNAAEWHAETKLIYFQLHSSHICYFVSCDIRLDHCSQ